MKKLELFLKVSDYVYFEYDGKKKSLKNLFDFIKLEMHTGKIIIDDLDKKELMELSENFKNVTHYDGYNFKDEKIEKIYFNYYGKTYHLEVEKKSSYEYELKAYEFTV